MFKLDLSLDSAPISAALQELEKKHLPFVLMLTATRLAQRVKKGTITVMGKRLDRPTPTTLNSLFVKMASKGKPAQVYFKDEWTSGVPADTYLQQTVVGGLRPHKRFEKALIARGLMKSSQYALPNASLLNQYGNVSRGTMLKILSGLGAAELRSGYQANASISKRSKRKGNAHRFFSGAVDGQQGIWERKTIGRAEGVRPVFVFSDGAPGYRTIFPFFKIGENIVKANYAVEFADAFAHAMATAKP
ncbi:hypothetical protein [Pseudomonas vancouverensis]|uniref:Uncharacterized protein n=1 Tax=Pseudomonas vancouverensis TaxID=95300 RepID=A0A1H2N8K6_PSEVA|nr:hypothetical protein [Pseudomonas vancouverensis]KAB0494006.1 hypothetical protein F7R09_19705 [Pseudomonas vancouverensis]TDB61443.1 hypothetical protein EIY72_15355 [Pseudomonas vancouverensis]SDV01598.1 hypothetical protein SAMN05216558_1852 [Pseudomonas vancouverensis]